jgi:hypothetical protein
MLIQRLLKFICFPVETPNLGVSLMIVVRRPDRASLQFSRWQKLKVVNTVNVSQSVLCELADFLMLKTILQGGFPENQFF